MAEDEARTDHYADVIKRQGASSTPKGVDAHTDHGAVMLDVRSSPTRLTPHEALGLARKLVQLAEYAAENPED
jgi:hypothetical protein